MQPQRKPLGFYSTDEDVSDPYSFSFERWWMAADEEVESYVGIAIVYTNGDDQKVLLMSKARAKELAERILKEVNESNR